MISAKRREGERRAAPMTLRHLQIFKTVCEKMSVTAAAEALGMTQPAVSVAVRELEGFYGVRLFDRIGRKIYLTEPGRRLQADAEAILSRFAASLESIRGGAGESACRIGANATVAECFLAPLLSALQAAVPSTAFSVFIGNSREIEQKLSENALDLALLDTVGEAANRTAEPLCSDAMAVVCAPDFACPDRLTVAALAAQPLLLREKGSGGRSCVDAVLETHDCKARPRAEGATNLGLLRLAEGGFGVAVLPAALAEDALAAGRLRRIQVTDGAFFRRYYLAYLTQKYRSPALERVMEAVRAFFAAAEPR